jgi:beta-N-acetylhexosaminidase
MVSHAAYPAVTRDRTPASLSKVWITDILRKKIGYRNLIVSDDLEMGGVLSAAPVGEAAVEFIRGGGDLCLVCHQEDRVMEAYEALVNTADQDPLFARRAAEAALRVAAFKKKFAETLRRAGESSIAEADNLAPKVWEFSEQVRLRALISLETRRHKRNGEPRTRRAKE